MNLDDGGLVVEPAAPDQASNITEQEADQRFRAADAVRGLHENPFLEFGLITIRRDLTVGLPQYDRRPGWAGFAQGGPHSCPGMPASPPTTSNEPPHHGFDVVVMDAAGHNVIAYKERGSFCRGPATGPTVSRPLELVSVPWRFERRCGESDCPGGQGSAGSLAVSYVLPPCGEEKEVNTTSGPDKSDIEVVLGVPYDDASQSRCGPAKRTTTIVEGVASGRGLQHPPTGPIRSLQEVGRD